MDNIVCIDYVNLSSESGYKNLQIIINNLFISYDLKERVLRKVYYNENYIEIDHNPKISLLPLNKGKLLIILCNKSLNDKIYIDYVNKPLRIPFDPNYKNLLFFSKKDITCFYSFNINSDCCKYSNIDIRNFTQNKISELLQKFNTPYTSKRVLISPNACEFNCNLRLYYKDTKLAKYKDFKLESNSMFTIIPCNDSKYLCDVIISSYNLYNSNKIDYDNYLKKHKEEKECFKSDLPTITSLEFENL